MKITTDANSMTQLDTGQKVGIPPDVAATATASVQPMGNHQEQNQTGNSDPQDVQQSVKTMQKHLNLMQNTSFQLEYDKDIDRVIVKYVNNDTGEVVSQIPSKEFLGFAKDFVKTIGLLFDKRV